MSALQELQRSMKTGSVADFRLSRILPEYVTEDVYGTLALATNPDVPNQTAPPGSPSRPESRYHVIDPNDLLVEGIEETITRGFEFFQLAGLAIKNGASPNLYVTVRIPILDQDGIQIGDEQMSVMHVIAYAWKVYMERGYDYRPLLAIIALLCAAGSDARLPVTDRKILLERKRDEAPDPACVSAAEVISTSGAPRSVLNVIAQSQDLPELLEGYPNAELLVHDSDYLSTTILKYIAVFTAFKGTLADVRRINIDGTFTAGDLQLSVPIRYQDRLDVIDLASQIGEALDDPSHMSGEEGPQKLNSCMNVHANRCAALILASKMITIGQAEDAFFEAVHAYNGKGVELMIDNAFVPKYNHVDRMLFIALKKKGEALPISAEIITGMIVMMSEKGVSLDNQQMRIAGIVSQPTFTRLSEIQLEPYWQRTCRVPGDYVRQDLRQLARTLDLNPELDKASLCAEFRSISSVTTSSLSSASRRLQSEKMSIPSTTLGDLIGRSTLRTPVRGNRSPVSRSGASPGREAPGPTSRTQRTPTPGPASQPLRTPEGVTSRTPASESTRPPSSARSRPRVNVSVQVNDEDRTPPEGQEYGLPEDEVQAQLDDEMDQGENREEFEEHFEEQQVTSQVSPQVTSRVVSQSPQVISPEQPQVVSTRYAPICNPRDDLAPENNETCANASQLTRAPATYSKLDLHRVRDSSNGRTYCFESVDYPTLLRTRTNEYTGARLTTMDLEAINAKYRTLVDLGLPLESESIEHGIKRLKGHGTHQDYELYVRSKRDAFLALLNDPEIGISTELFTYEPEDGGLLIDEMQEIINNIGRSQNITLTPLDNREHALRSVAMTFMEYVEEISCNHTNIIRRFSEEECDDQLHMLFENLVYEVNTVAGLRAQRQ